MAATASNPTPSNPTGSDSTGSRPARGWRLVGLAGLLVLGLFYVFGAVSDLVSDAGHGIPVDHDGTFTALAGSSFDQLTATAPGVAGYITVLERGYALHELTFAVLFIAVIAVPFRRGKRWAWCTAWVPMIANLGYTFTFGIHDPSILGRSLIADIALPVLLLAHVPVFFPTLFRRPPHPATPASS